MATQRWWRHTCAKTAIAWNNSQGGHSQIPTDISEEMTLGTLRRAATTGLAAGLATALALAVLAGGAWAVEYHVYSCRTPSGQVAPTDGWSPSEHPSYDPTLNTCPSGGGLIAALDAGDAHLSDTENDEATWSFKAPEGSVITEATLWRAGENLGGGTTEASYLFWLAASPATGPNTHIFDKCIASNGCPGQGNLAYPFAPENRVIVHSNELNGPYLSMSAYCGSEFIKSCPTNEGGKITYDAEVELFAADITLSQSTGPTVSAVSGGLDEDPTVSGTSDVAFHASDPGSGVYEAIVEADGQAIAHEVIDEDGGRCHNVGGTTDGLPAFLYTQPCPAEASADIPFDTTALTNGEHHLVVRVTDAAGNAAAVLDREIDVANPVAPGPLAPAVCAASAPARSQGAGKSPVLSAGWKGHRGTRLRARYGPVRTIEGTLTGPAGASGSPPGKAPTSGPGASGKAIPGAQLEVCELPAYKGAPAVLLAAPRTGPTGHWSLALPRDLPSATLRVSYWQSPTESQPVALSTLTLTVPAALHLHISPRTAASAGTIHFGGRLRGVPIPPGGKQLVLEARSPGGPWIEFHVIRTRASGRFAYLYHFRLPGPARYQFRVLCEADADFPFATGASNVVGVFEG